MSLYPYKQVRDDIEHVNDYEVRNFLKTVYLLAVARPVELLYEPVSGQTITYGVKGTDVKIEKIDKPPLSITQTAYMLSKIEKNKIKISEVKNNLSKKIDVAVFKIPFSRQSRRKEKLEFREVAIPTQPNLEPWTQDLLKCFNEAGNDYVFHQNRTQYYTYVKNHQVFKNLTAIIREYRKTEHTISRKKSTKVAPHERELNSGGLSKVRKAELQTEYSFDDYDVATYTGTQISLSTKKVLRMDWHQYINKLCQKIHQFETEFIFQTRLSNR